MKKALLMLSGGKDSMLSAIRMRNMGYQVNMVTYDNGSMMHDEYFDITAKKLIAKFPEMKFHGLVDMAKLKYELYCLVANLTPSETMEKYGNTTWSQETCLVCRTAMYIKSMQLCKEYGYEAIGDGARTCQKFVIELEPMIHRYKELISPIDLITPVLDMEDDWKEKNEILRYGIVPKGYECQCLLGCPIHGELGKDVVQGTVNIYDRLLLPYIKEHWL